MSGSPPREILYTDPITNDPPTDYTRIFRPRSPDRSTDSNGTEHVFAPRAFHWGGLTSGHWATAFWMLLSPFAFANVAGWMTVKATKLSHATIRLAGLALTALFVVQMGYLFLEIPTAIAWPRAAVVVSLLAYVVLFAGVVVVWLSTQSHFSKRLGWLDRLRLNFHPAPRFMLPPAFWDGNGGDIDVHTVPLERQWDDPAGKTLEALELWSVHAIAHRLRRLHLACGLAVISTLAAVGLEVTWLFSASLALFAVVVILTIATTVTPRSDLVKTVTAWTPVLGLVLVAAGLWRVAVDPLPVDTWRDIHNVTFVIAIALGVAAVGTVSAGLVSVGAVTIGTLFGGSLGIGAALVMERFAGIDRITDEGAGWVAVAMILLLFTILITAIALSFMKTAQNRTEGGLMFATIRRITVRGRVVFVAAALFGLVAGTVAVLVGCVFGENTSCDPAGLGVPERGGVVYTVAAVLAATLIAALVVRVLTLKPKVPIAVGALVVGGIAGWLIWRFHRGSLGFSADLRVDYNDLVAVSTLVIILIPTGFILKSLAESLLTKATNRQVGILWDLASFWPRWFHPLAPPGYGPKVVTDLRQEISDSKPDLLEAHSQGSVIAAVTLSQTPSVPDGLALITYGSPLGILYPQLFPATGVEGLIAQVTDRVGGRWRNLWRDDDPLGGLPIGLGGADILVVEGSGHAGYERSKTFRDTRQGLVE